MITHSGAQVWPNGSRYEQGGVPTIPDIAQGLGRMVRFAGQSPTFYTVLPHTLVVADLAEEMGFPEYRPHALLHDAAESMIADVPSPWKTDDRRELEAQLTERISRYYGVSWPWPQEATDVVAQADLDAMVAESRVLGLWDRTPAHEEYWGSFPLTANVERAMEMTHARLMRSEPVMFLEPLAATSAFQGALAR